MVLGKNDPLNQWYPLTRLLLNCCQGRDFRQVGKLFFLPSEMSALQKRKVLLDSWESIPILLSLIFEDGIMVKQIKPVAVMPASHMSAYSSSHCSTSLPGFC